MVRKGRTLMCLLGVAVSVAMIVSILSISHGVRISLNSYMKESGASLVVFDRSAADLAFGTGERRTFPFLDLAVTVSHNHVDTAHAGRGAAHAAGATATPPAAADAEGRLADAPPGLQRQERGPANWR